MQFPPVSILILCCGAVSAAIAFYGWQRRSSIGTRSFSLFMGSMAVYIAGYAFELASPDLGSALFWSKVQYAGTLTFPTLYLMYVIQYTGRAKWLTHKNVVLLFTLPACFLFVKLFDDQLHLIYASVEMNLSGPIPLMTFTRGPFYLAIVVYQLIVVTIANYLVLQKRRHSSHLYRTQTSIMLAGALVVYVVYILYVAGIPLSPALEGFDVNPFAFAIWAGLVSLAIFRYRLLDLAPIARDTLIEKLSDGVIVLDAQTRVADANPQALKIIGWDKIPVGEPACHVMQHWIEQAVLEALQDTHKYEIFLTTGYTTSYYEVTCSVLTEKNRQKIGYLILVHDISHQKEVEKELHELTLQDELTGLTNRRGFKILADQMIHMANRMQMNAPLFYLDIDRFKWINDNLGHAAGDQALRDAAAALKNSFRSSDIIARFGGDEFVVLAIESNENTAAVMLERLEENMRKLAHANPNNRLSFSIGLTHYQWDQPRTMEALLEEADRGMYEMKQAKKELQGVPKT